MTHPLHKTTPDSLPIDKLSIRQTLHGYSSGKFSPVDVAKCFITRAKSNEHLNAVIYNMFDSLIEEAKHSENRYHNKKNLPLDGIIMGIKDLFCTKNVRTTACSKMLENFVPLYESTVTANLKLNGAIGIGKTNMDEFAMGSANSHSYFGQAYSPWGKNLVPGGSSGGSASSVSARLCHFATGSDTGGSIRQPAAYTGLVGIKPTYGRCSRFGMVSFASSLDQAGTLARSVEDAAISLQYMMGYDPYDSTSVKLDVPDLSKIVLNLEKPRYKLGVPFKLLDKIPNQALKDAVNNALLIAEKLGMEIIPIDLDGIKHSLEVYYIIAPAEASSNLARYDGIRFGHTKVGQVNELEEMYSQTRYEGFGKEVKRRIFIGTYVLSSEAIESYYIKAQKVRRMIFNEFKSCFEKVDGIFIPTAPSSALEIDKLDTQSPEELYMTDIFTIPASLAGLPAMSIPIGFDKGLPLGGQIITNHFEEEKMIHIAKILEDGLNINPCPKDNLVN